MGRCRRLKIPTYAGPPSSAELLAQRLHEIRDGDAYLLHLVTGADGDGFVLQRLEVDGDAEGRADLVLAAVAAADALRVVVLRHEVRAQGVPDAAGGRDELLVARERQDGDLDRRQVGF